MRTEKEQKSPLEKLKEFLSDNFKYHVEYEYEHSDCSGCKGICRCKTIISKEITSININCITNRILGIFKKKSIITQYCVDRLARRSGLNDPESYYISVSDGYYGEEINRISYEGQPELLSKVEELLKLSDNEKIYYVLKEEYGYILPAIQNKQWEVRKIEIKDIDALNEEYYRKLNKEDVDLYIDYELPIGICIKNDEGVRLIDGYHRFCAKHDEKKVKVILGV